MIRTKRKHVPIRASSSSRQYVADGGRLPDESMLKYMTNRPRPSKFNIVVNPNGSATALCPQDPNFQVPIDDIQIPGKTIVQSYFTGCLYCMKWDDTYFFRFSKDHIPGPKAKTECTCRTSFPHPSRPELGKVSFRVCVDISRDDGGRISLKMDSIEYMSFWIRATLDSTEPTKRISTQKAKRISKRTLHTMLNIFHEKYDMPSDYFLLYSEILTLVGEPGIVLNIFTFLYPKLY